MRWSKWYGIMRMEGRIGGNHGQPRDFLLVTTTATVLLLTFSSYRWVGRYVDVSRVGSLQRHRWVYIVSDKQTERISIV